MDAHVRNIRQVLSLGDQFLVPEFQRRYEWDKMNWETLFADIVALTKEENTEHFLGPLVCTPFHPAPCVFPQHLLIDGQQRLVTISLALAALRDLAKLAGFKDLAEEIEEDFLLFKRRQGIQRLRVVPQAGQDRTDYGAVIDGTVAGTTESRGIPGAYSFFKRQWRPLIVGDGEVAAQKLLAATTTRLCLVVITITTDRENPFEIFESLNTKNKPLEDSDVIRNFLFRQVPLDEQAAFKRTHWEPFENLFEASGRHEKLPITPFYRSYLMRNGNYCRKKATYAEFKSQNKARGLPSTEQTQELQRFATFELWLRRPSLYESTGLAGAFEEIQALEVSKTAHPLLLNLLDRHSNGQSRLSADDLLSCFRDFASFVIRRWICREQTRSYDRLFTDAIKAIQVRPQQDLQRFWLENGWPTDNEFMPRLVEFPIYSSAKPKCRLLLEKLEKQRGHQEEIDLSHPNIQIEHVLPQTLGEDADGDSWRRALAHDWRALHGRWLHTLGNLTLTGYNLELTNSSFAKKKELFVESHLSLNEYFVPLPDWNAPAIMMRGDVLARIVADIYPRPAGGPPYVPPGPSVTGDTEESDRETGEAEVVVPPGAGRLKIQIRWPLLGVDDRGEQTICERQSAKSIVKLLVELIRVFKEPMKQQLTQVNVIRFPLSPDRNSFWNNHTHRPYGSLPVPGTTPNLYFCPHSGNEEKIKRLRTFVSRLKLPDGRRFPDGSVQVSIAEDPLLEALLA